jgi:GNAT superfamily N-acetyltransferase
MCIRPLQKRDRAAIARIVHSVGNFTPEEEACAMELVDVVLDRPGQGDYLCLAAAGENEEVRGYVLFGPVPLAAGVYDLYWIAVDPGTQGRGVGRALVQSLEDWVRGREGRLIVIETSSKPGYENTNRFYGELGYETLARIRDFYRPGDDKIVYGKRFEP